MFCDKCGSSIAEGSKFCLKCGNRLPAADAAAPAPQAPPPFAGPPPQQASRDSDRKKGAGAFFTSPGGIILMVVLALLVVGGLTVGIIFAVRGGGGSEVDAATMDVWAEYESILEDDGRELAQINTDPNALAANQEALRKSQEKVEELEKVLARTGGSEEFRANPRRQPDNTRDIKAAQLAAALEVYRDYIWKMDEFLGALITAVAGNQLIDAAVVDSLNAILAEVQDLADDARRLAGKFVEGNDQVAAADFDPEVLEAAVGIAAEVEKSVAAAQAAEAARLEAEKQAADAQAAELERQRQEAEQQAQYVTCPHCNGVGTSEGGDGRYTCPFCGGSGRVTRSKAAGYNWMDWI